MSLLSFFVVVGLVALAVYGATALVYWKGVRPDSLSLGEFGAYTVVPALLTFFVYLFAQEQQVGDMTERALRIWTLGALAVFLAFSLMTVWLTNRSRTVSVLPFGNGTNETPAS